MSLILSTYTYSSMGVIFQAVMESIAKFIASQSSGQSATQSATLPHPNHALHVDNCNANTPENQDSQLSLISGDPGSEDGNIQMANAQEKQDS